MTMNADSTTTTVVGESHNLSASNDETSRFKASVDVNGDHDAYDSRPSTAVGRYSGIDLNGTPGSEPPKRPIKPTLQRSKSDFAPRPLAEQEDSDDEMQVWGARHGFEDHYQSEHIITQLATVCDIR